MPEKIRIGKTWVGAGEPCFIIAEAGVNHNGDIRLAKKLIDAASEAKADAVKFQTFHAESVVTKDAEKAEYQKEITCSRETQYDMIKKLELNEDDFKRLNDYCKRKGIIFMSSPFDEESVDFLYKLNVPAFKIASGEITNFPLLRKIARKGRPIILSTGMSTIGEIREALDAIKEEDTTDIILLHCITQYPTRPDDVNLKAIETLRKKFKVPVGFSDHTLGIHISIASVALGACMIEKHFTLDRDLPGPDHKASLEPNELRSMVTAIREVEKALGDGVKMPTEDEEEIKKIARRSIIAKENIDEGSIIERGMLCFKRPGTGIEPKSMGKVVGSKAKKAIRKDEIITMDKIHDKEDG
jgi:N,N'-diacetyllegionaminate synthase